MMKTTNTHALYKVKHLVDAILGKMTNISKTRKEFMTCLFETWLLVPLRCTMLNLSCFGQYCEKSIRLHFEKSFDFVGFNSELIKRFCNDHLIAAFDPSFLRKAGKHTPGLGWYWNGKANCSELGLEVGCLAIIDVATRTATALKAVLTNAQTNKQNNTTLVEHYLSIIMGQLETLKQLGVKYLTVDGYFMKQAFIISLVEAGLHVITKVRCDADLRYLYNGPVRKGRGRPKIYDGKVDCANIDKRRMKQVDEDEQHIYYSGLVYCVILKRIVRIVYIRDKKTQQYVLLLGTDTALDPCQIVNYYQLRFQIEFLLRDAKQHSGLEDCQARSERKLNFHLNMSLSVVSIAKAITLFDDAGRTDVFSMRTIKILYYNKFLAERIFSNLALDLNCKKIRELYEECLNIDKLAA